MSVSACPKPARAQPCPLLWRHASSQRADPNAAQHARLRAMQTGRPGLAVHGSAAEPAHTLSSPPCTPRTRWTPRAPARIAYPALTLTTARPHAGRAPAPATRSRPAGAACIGLQRGAAAAPPAAPAAPPRACRAPSAAPGAPAHTAAASTACPPPSCRALEAATGSANCAQRSPGQAAPLPGPAVPAGPAAAAGARSAPGQLSGAAELADRRDGRRS